MPGITATVPTAAISPHKISCPPTRLGTMMVNVRTSLRVNSSANMNSFQVKTNENSAVATKPGVTRGNATRQKAPNGPAPSISAASSSSTGRSSKKPLSSQMTNGRLKMVLAMINAMCLSSQSNCLKIKKSGNAEATGGNMRVESTQNERF